MALVAYGDSDTSDCEEEDDPSSIPVVNGILSLTKDSIKNESSSTKNAVEMETILPSRLNLPAPKSPQRHTESESNLFSKLPQPKGPLADSVVIEQEDEFLKKKEKPEIKPPPPIRKPVKIQLTALSEFQDDECREFTVQQKTVMKPSGLLGMLPPPKQVICSMKNKKSMVPHILTRKPIPKSNRIKVTSSKHIPRKEQTNSLLISYDSSDESESEGPNEKSDNGSSDFFSLNDDYKLPEISYEELNIKPMKTLHDLPIQQDDHVESNNVNIYENNEYSQVEHEPDGGNTELQLDEEALRQLCGSRAKRYKPENIQIIDMSHKDVLPNEEEWMREALQEQTAGPRSHGVKALGGPSSTQKRKHQITYLAHQAKANELELQNQWANNRMTRRQTQSKYGF